MKTIPLTQGFAARIDDADYERVSQYKWRVRRKNAHTMYAVTGRGIRMHRFILGITDPTVQVDHRDRDGLNNQRENLRKCINGENQANKLKQHGTYTSQFKGVCWHKVSSAWRACITIRRKHVYLGLFENEADAARAYDAAARAHFGEFCHVNFPEKPC